MSDYISLFKPIAFSGLKIHIYTSPELAKNFIDYPSNIKIFVVPLDIFEIYRLGLNAIYELPLERNPDKDTREYLSLQNTKVEFLLRSSEICEDETIIWIDFAILKLFKKSEDCIKLLHQIDSKKFEKINIPGCWYKDEGHYINSVHWRFCGSFVIVPRHLAKRFFDDSRKLFIDFCRDYKKITWEVNIWCCLEYFTKKEYIHWYYALHDDSMIRNLLENIDPWTGQKFEVG